jgi:hypothetical protein
MAFDLDAFRAAHEPWTFMARGRTYVARHVSAPQVMRYEQAIRRADSERARYAALWRLLRYAFPWRLSYLVYGDPVRVVMSLEPRARIAALTDFFACLRGPSPTTPTPPAQTNGTGSPEPTPTRSP